MSGRGVRVRNPRAGRMGSGHESESPTAWYMTFSMQIVQFVLSATALLLVAHMAFRPSYVIMPSRPETDVVLFRERRYGGLDQPRMGKTFNVGGLLGSGGELPSKGIIDRQDGRESSGTSEEDDLKELSVLAANKSLNSDNWEPIPVIRNWPDKALIDKVLEPFGGPDVRKQLLVAAVSCNFLDMADNWLTAVGELGISNYVLVALDDDAYRILHARIPQHTLASPVQANSTSPDYGTDGFASVVRSRPVLLTHLLRTGHDILYSDVDMVFKSNPFKEIPPGFDIVGPTDSYLTEQPHLTERDKENICTGLLYFTPTEASFELLARWNMRLIRGMRKLNQGAFNRALNDMGFLSNGKARIHVHVLDKDAFPSGFMYFGNELWTHRESWAPSRPAVMVHNNFMQRKSNKVQRFKDFGLWKLSGMFNGSCCPNTGGCVQRKN